MINWFEFKGINSERFKNLIVQDLPPISKPSMRTDVIYHDGADGATINELGYDMVPKFLKIALRNNENIDQIIAWLTGSGRLTFSNEPNKYYIASITDQIDFERFGRFSTALIPFLCKPYKYLRDESSQSFTTAGTYRVYNNGTVTSKPLITIYATDTVEFTVNGYEYAANLNEYYPNCQIDSDIMNAYTNLYGEWQSKNVLFEEGEGTTPPFPVLNPGENTLVISGTFTSFEVSARSRFV
jgi:predicted phage tail component-like protein